MNRDRFRRDTVLRVRRVEEDRAKAEWTSIDRAMLIGEVAASPVGGLEPVHVVSELSPQMVKSLALRPGEVRSLGWKWPRRWISL